VTVGGASIVLTTDADGVRTITLNRPEVRNAFNSALYRAAGEAFDAADADDTVRVIVFTGAGPGFSAGQDLKEMAALGARVGDDPEGAAEDHGFRTFIDAIERCSKPVIAAVHGPAVGIGTTLLPYCDLVVVADDARLRLPFVPLGVVPEAGSSFTIPAIVGRQRSAWLLLSGDWLDGPGAVEAGLALRCVPRSELEATVAGLAAHLAGLSAASLTATKALVRAGWIDAARSAREREEAVFSTLLGQAASRAALDEFLAR
jgi:enoyl-CoA hydratase/carnithine racemase